MILRFLQPVHRLWVGDVKFVSTLFALAGIAAAGPGDPGNSAVGFLEKVRSGNVSLEPGADTAISAQVTERKRDEIKRRLQRIARDIGVSPLEIGPVKVDDNLAAVLVRKIGGFDPSRLQVFPVGLVRSGDSWQPTPVPASFENTGISYAAGIRPRLDALETWMQREQVVDLENLREDAEARLRRSIRKHLAEEEVRGFSSEQAATRFLSACSRRSLPEILGMLGGLCTPLPTNWPERLRLAEVAVSNAAECPRPWRLLTSASVLRMPVFHDQEPDEASAIHSVACLDPAGASPRSTTGKIEIIHVPVSRNRDGLWQVNPPQEFFASAEESQTQGAPADASLLDLFPSKFAGLYPPSPAGTATEARAALIAALRNRKSMDWARLMHLQGEPARRRDACARAARIWWDAACPSAPSLAEPLDFLEKEQVAAVAIQFFDARNPDKSDLRILHLEKTGMGWLWNPLPSDEILAVTQPWVDENTPRWQKSWRDQLLQACPETRTQDTAPPTPDDAVRVVEAFLKSAVATNVSDALRQTARLVLPDSGISLLRNLGHEMAGYRTSSQAANVVGTHSAGSITAVATRRITDGKTIDTLYPVAATASGPRILLEIDLIASRGRDFLNRTALDRLRKTDATAADRLAAILAETQAAPPKPAAK